MKLQTEKFTVEADSIEDIKALLELIESAPRSNPSFSQSQKWGPSETKWRSENPGLRAPVYKQYMQAKFPEGKEQMFSAILNGTFEPMEDPAPIQAKADLDESEGF